VAMDARGNVAAATSSGGFPLKLPGRVGDVPIIGAGTYADNRKGACSVTGQGEVVIKMGLAKLVCDLMGSGIPAQQAVESAVAQWNTRFGRYILALVALDMNGTVGACRNVQETPHVWLEEGGPEHINWSPILRPTDR
ncbi:MAG TPA: isoaspartyl peptidase/L-asparaginase, partial [Candidatus Methylomirabilis sp.]